MHTQTTREQLKDLIKFHDLSHKDIARLIDVSLPTVKSWLTDNAKNHRRIPSRIVTLLELRLREQQLNRPHLL
jgi:DNA-directed RNA polymerase specialized sigma24 family protein